MPPIDHASPFRKHSRRRRLISPGHSFAGYVLALALPPSALLDPLTVVA